MSVRVCNNYSKALGTAPKVKQRYDLIKSVTNQKGIKGFPSMGKVPSAIKDSMEIVRQLLDA